MLIAPCIKDLFGMVYVAKATLGVRNLLLIPHWRPPLFTFDVCHPH